MRLVFIILISGITLSGRSQSNLHSREDWYKRIFESHYVQQVPVCPMGVDSCRHYYFCNFSVMDSLIAKAAVYGDTSKYLRVYFSFVIDRYGLITEPHFIRIASTRYAKSLNAKTVLYFLKDELYYEKAIKQMLRKMSSWKPAMQDGIPVSCRVEDYFQFWIGSNKPF